MSDFAELFEQYNWNDVKESITSKTEKDVQHALSKTTQRDLEDFKALLSPAAAHFLEEMAQQSHQRTRARFGNTIGLFAPLYLSNECSNGCTYCGFAIQNKIQRKTLDTEELLQEVDALKALHYQNILLLTGEAPKQVGVDYIESALQTVRPHFSQVSAEVQPLEQKEYERLIKAGLEGVYVYQETYHLETYREIHPVGKKSNFKYRLHTPDRLGRAGMRTIGLGALLGLEDWRTDSFFTALHLQYLEKKYWRSQYSISFPRLRPHAGEFQPKVSMTNSEFVQLVCAYRIFNQEIGLSLSTRESPTFRDNLIQLGFTSMSAGAKTNPGGYANQKPSLEQFSTSDQRSPKQVATMLESKGLEPVWKNWDQGYA